MNAQASAEMREDGAALLAWHFAGGLLLGAYPPIESIPDEVEEERLQDLVAAVIGVHLATGSWPVDLVHVAETLERRGVFAPAGGFAFLCSLIEDWSEREERAIQLTALSVIAREAQRRFGELSAAEQAAEDALVRLERTRARATEVLRLLPAAEAS